MLFAHRVARMVLPLAAAELAQWEARARRIPSAELRRQALASLRLKRFHAEGGSVYAAFAPQAAHTLVALIVALQTVSDYLDNLCDRSVSLSGRDFRQLHQAMLDAVTADAPTADYYRHHPNKDDGGYLRALVERCRQQLRALPSYAVVQPTVRRLIGLYNDLQVYKHIRVDEREPRLLAWYELHRRTFPDVRWNEFAAASGSTLGVFALFAAATRPNLTVQEAGDITRAYFPWVCALHILLDYFIDQEEDRLGGDLNFVRYYADEADTRQRLRLIYTNARRQVASLPNRALHEMVVDGLPGLYLSDDKVARQSLQPIAWDLLKAGGARSLFLFGILRLRREVAAMLGH